MANSNEKKVKHVSSPRLSDEGRMARFMNQTGLNLPGSAKARRAKAKKGGRR